MSNLKQFDTYKSILIGNLVSDETKNIVEDPIIVMYKDGKIVEYPEPVLKSDVRLDDVDFFLSKKYGFNFSLKNVYIKITEILVETKVYINDPIFGTRKDQQIVGVKMEMIPEHSSIEFDL